MLTRTGWIGTGNLGYSIAETLQPSFPLIVYNRTFSKASGLRDKGAIVVRTAHEVFDAADMIFFCLSDHTATREVLSDVLLRGSIANKILIDLSTIPPHEAVQLHSLAERSGCSYLEAPVSGGPENAIAGKLTTIIAGEAGAYRKAQAVINRYADKVIYVEQAGWAQTIKLANNLAESINLLAAAEIISICKGAGIPTPVFDECLRTMRGYSTYMGVLLDRLQPGSHKVSASLNVRIKDIINGLQVAEATGIEPILGRTALGIFRNVRQHAGGEQDQTSCIQFYQPSTVSNEQS